MITIMQKEKIKHGDIWEAEVEGKESCKKCKKQLQPFDIIYVCGICKKAIHKECVTHASGKIDTKLFCEHFIQRYEYYRCEVTKCLKQKDQK